MAGQLIQVATETITSQVSSVQLTGIDSDNVYMVAIRDVRITNHNDYLYMRVTKGGTDDSTANYDYAVKDFRAGNSFVDRSSTNQTWWNTWVNMDNAVQGETANAIFYLYNFNSANEYSFVTMEQVHISVFGTAYGSQGGMVHTVASASDGVWFDFNSGNIAEGTFTLYKVV